MESRAAGVPQKRPVVIAFTASAGFAALAGGLISIRSGSASPLGFEAVLLETVAACLIGGVALDGGRGGFLGILIGLLTLRLVISGIASLGAPFWAQNLAAGLLLSLGDRGRGRVGRVPSPPDARVTPARRAALHREALMQEANRKSSTDGTASPALGDEWFPSVWGRDDEIGAGNLLGPHKTLAAIRLVKTGQIVKLDSLIGRACPYLPAEVSNCACPAALPAAPKASSSGPPAAPSPARRPNSSVT